MRPVELPRRVGQPAPRLGGCQRLAIDAVATQGSAAALHFDQLMTREREIGHSSLADHRVVVELLRKPPPQLERVLVQRRALVVKIVGPRDGHVAARVAEADRTALEQRDVAHTVVLGQVLGRR